MLHAGPQNCQCTQLGPKAVYLAECDIVQGAPIVMSRSAAGDPSQFELHQSLLTTFSLKSLRVFIAADL
jgi:hypothetical protein